VHTQTQPSIEEERKSRGKRGREGGRGRGRGRGWEEGREGGREGSERGNTNESEGWRETGK
jgi:hypothetical protein